MCLNFLKRFLRGGRLASVLLLVTLAKLLDVIRLTYYESRDWQNETNQIVFQHSYRMSQAPGTSGKTAEKVISK